MGNAWLDFLAEERKKEENKDVPMLKLAGHVRPKYDDWKKANGIESKTTDKAHIVKKETGIEDEVEVIMVKMKRGKKGKKCKSAKKGKSTKKGKRGTRRR